MVLLVLHVETVVSAPALADCHQGGTWPWTCRSVFITLFMTMSFAGNDKIACLFTPFAASFHNVVILTHVVVGSRKTCEHPGHTPALVTSSCVRCLSLCSQLPPMPSMPKAGAVPGGVFPSQHSVPIFLC